jgi:hypothetical protein
MKNVGKELCQLDSEKDKWKFLSDMVIEGNHVIVGKI